MDNTVGSLTQFQRSVIIGTLLGDGYLRIFPKRKDALLEINHSYTQKEYVDWKYSVLRNVCTSAPKMRKGNGSRIAYRFYSKQLAELTELYEQFYRGGKKIIPENLVIDPIILSVWFMDDGSRCRDCDVYLNTQQFSIEDQKKLIYALSEVGLEANLNKDKIYYRLRFLKSSLPKLRALLKGIVISSMQYKLSYNPVETSIKRLGVAPRAGQLIRHLL
ncbi:MAG: LAGLIDADG endonuclease [bacterium]|nr:LAGLIDADG endonuclease [bacterium]